MVLINELPWFNNRWCHHHHHHLLLYEKALARSEKQWRESAKALVPDKLPPLKIGDTIWGEINPKVTINVPRSE